MKKSLMFLAVMTFCAVASAQMTSGYMGFEGGYSSITDDSDSLRSKAIADFGGTATASQKTGVSSYRVFGGVDVNDKVSLELGYIASSSVSSTLSGRSSTAVNYTLDIGAKLTGFDYSAVWFPNRTSSQRGGFVKFGGHSTKISGNGSVVASGKTYSAELSTSGTGLQFGIGYEGDLTKTVDYRLGISRYSKLAGESGSGVTVLSAGVISRF